MTGTTRTTTTLSGGLLLLALGAPLLLAGPAQAVGPLPVPPPVSEAVAPVVKAVEPVVAAVTAPVVEAVVEAAPAVKPVVEPVVDAVVERAPEPARPVARPVAEAATKALPDDPDPRPAPRPSSTARPQVVPPTVGSPGSTGPGTSAGNAPVRPASGTSPSPVARPAAGADSTATLALPATGPAAGAGVAAVAPARIGGGLTVGSDVGRGVAEAPITAGMPAFSDIPDGTPTVVAAPLAAPPSGLLPTGPSRPTDLPAALVVFAAITLAAVGTGQLTEVVSRRRAASVR